MTGVLWILVAEVLFSFMRLATRVNAETLPWTALASTRFLGGAVVVVAVARATRASLRIRDRRSTWLRAIFGTGSSVGVFYALGSSEISVGDATTLSATAPLFVAALSRPLLGEPVTRRVMIGILLGFLGVVTIVGPSFGTAGPAAFVALAGAASYAMAMVYLRRVGPRESSEAVALHVSLVAGGSALFLLLGGGITGHGPASIAWERVEWWAVLVAGAAGGLSQVAVTRAYALERAARLGAVSYAGVLLTYTLEAVALARVPTPLQILGAALVVAAGLVTVTRGGRPSSAAASASADGDG